jgi:NAD(P)H-flavin reductase
MIQKYSVKTVSKEVLTDKIIDLQLELLEPKIMDFKAGQFVAFLVPNAKKKFYSIASLPEQASTLEFCVDISPQGDGSKFVEALKVGDEFGIEGPHGVFVVKEDAPEQIALIATGAGIAPFKSMVPDTLLKSDKAIKLLFGVRSEKDVFYLDYFEELARRYPNFTFVPALSRPEGEWNGFVGRVTKYIDENSGDFKESLCYICGSPEMVKDVRSQLIALGLDPKAVKLEIFV